MAVAAQYSSLDKVMHGIAFGPEFFQSVLEDIENALFAKEWQDIKAEKPIFITSLPRAGTTIILEALHGLPELATHTYRDMPFVTSPVLWSKLSGRIRSESVERERAHGDGLMVSEDSPEAFEEILWRKYFPNNYSAQEIKLWSSINIEFTTYFQEHMRKIVLVRRPDNKLARYVSKNNGNIARTKAIKTMFPASVIVVPLRDPIEHAISLLRQHNNFLGQHVDDDFAQKYMGDIGHYEFGALHRPIAFPNMRFLSKGLSPESLDYWVAYWVAAFEYLSKQADVNFLSYENLCQDPSTKLAKLCKVLELTSSEENIHTAAGVFNAPPAKRQQEYKCDKRLVKRAEGTYRQLLELCLLKR